MKTFQVTFKNGEIRDYQAEGMKQQDQAIQFFFLQNGGLSEDEIVAIIPLYQVMRAEVLKNESPAEKT